MCAVGVRGWNSGSLRPEECGSWVGGRRARKSSSPSIIKGPFIFVDEVSTCYLLVLTVDSKYVFQCS